MQFTIKATGDSLCFTCKRATITKFADGKSQILCGEVTDAAAGGNRPGLIIRRVVECSSYRRVNSMTRNEMEQQAWIIEVRTGKQIGFLKPGSEEHKRIVGRYYHGDD